MNRSGHLQHSGKTASFGTERVKYLLTGTQWHQTKGHFTKNPPTTESNYLSPNPDSSDADDSLWHILDGHGEVEGAQKPQSLKQRHHHKHLAGYDQVVKELIGDEDDKNYNFSDSEKWCQIHSPKVGNSQNLGNFLPEKESRKEVLKEASTSKAWLQVLTWRHYTVHAWGSVPTPGHTLHHHFTLPTKERLHVTLLNTVGQLDWVWTFFQQAFITTCPGPGSPLITERHSLSPPGTHELVGEENKTPQNCETPRH